MFELYLGLIPGEAPIDRLADGAIADPALTSAIDAPTIIGDPGSGAVLAMIERDHVPARRAATAPGLWQHLRTRWTSAFATTAAATGGPHG